MPEFTEAELTAMWHELPTDAKGSLASAIAKLDAWKRGELKAKPCCSDPTPYCQNCDTDLR